MSATVAPPKTDSPSRKRDRTRAKLIEAAAELFSEKGIRAVSLDEVAARAGMTKGAIYSNFERKEDLISAVAEAKAIRFGQVFKPGLGLPEQIDLLADALIATLPEAAAQLPAATEHFLYILSDETLRLEAAAAFKAGSKRVGAQLAEVIDVEELSCTPEQLFVMVQAMTRGLLQFRAVVPELVTDDLIRQALQALARQAVTPPPGSPSSLSAPRRRRAR